ncbi:MAG: nucleotide exchange factor GrpE [Planctomycetes bacterium]|nr:nucleotide exchange factor GrpE [Planctomycetota bacterium]
MTTHDQPQPVKEPKSLSLEAQRDQLRERLQRRFEVWLDEALDPEAVPQGLSWDILEQLEAEAGDSACPPEGEEDLQSVCVALVGLTETARHHGTALEHLRQDLPAVQTLTETVSTMLERQAADQKIQAQERQAQDDKNRMLARRQVFQEVLGAVIDIRDRLGAGLADAQVQLDAIARVAAAPAPKNRWWQTTRKALPSPDTTLGQACLKAAIKANQLAVEGIDQTLGQWRVKIIEGLGQPMDPETMKAVDQMPDSDLPEGTVLKVLRAGYQWNGTLSRLAEVCVVQSPVSQ